MHEILVSVIIPVYNVEKTIDRAISSILRQTLKSIEIICVDDGSDDNTIKILKNMQRCYSNIVIISQSHLGSGTARNYGIESASGTYVAFLDADDIFVDVNALELMVDACRKNDAKICGSYRKIFENNDIKNTELLRKYTIPKDGCFIGFEEFQHDYDYQSFLFEREFLIINQIIFPAYMRYQDPPFFIHAMIVAKKFYVMPIVLYQYYFDVEKYKRLSEHSEDILRGIMDSLEMAEKYHYPVLFHKIKKRIDEEYKSVILERLSDEVLTLLLKINKISKEVDHEPIVILNEIYTYDKQLRRQNEIQEFLNNIIRVKQQSNDYTRFFEMRNIKKVCVYGLGYFGRILIDELRLCHVEIVCGIDQKAEVMENLKVIASGTQIPECDAVIISLLEYREILEVLQRRYGNKVYSFKKITEQLVKK